MAKEAEVFFQYKGREVMARCDICPAEPDVGIMGPYPESVRLFEMNGDEIKLTEAEEEELLMNAQLCEAVDGKYYAQFDDDVI